MHSKLSILTIVVTTLLFACCSHNRPTTTQLSMYSEESAMAHYLTNPERAIELIDSAVIIQNLTPQRADFLKATILYSSSNDLSESISLCQKLIDEEAWEHLPDSEDEVSFQVDVYRLMATIATTTGNNLAVIRYAKEGSELAHGIEKLRGDEADFMSRMGYALCRIGQTDEGMETMQRAETLALSDESWSSLITYLNNAKKMYHVLDGMEDYQNGNNVVDRAISTLEWLPGNISKVKFAPEGIVNDPDALEEFIQYYQVPFFSYKANMSAREGKLDSSAGWIKKVNDNPLSSDPTIKSSLVYPLIELGKYNEAKAIIREIKEVLSDNKVNDDYLSLLKHEKRLALIHGDEHEANLLSDQILEISEMLNANHLKIMLAEEATQYKLQEEQQKRADAERKMLIAVIISIILAALICGFFTFSYIKRILKRQKELKKKYAKAKKELEAFTGVKEEIEKTSNQEEIYRRAVMYMETKELFKNPDFDIVMLAQLIPTNRTYLSSAINTMSGMNFRSWLAAFRVNHAKKVLMNKPDITNDMLAEECGFDNRISLYRQFKAIEGMTPNEWIASKNK